MSGKLSRKKRVISQISESPRNNGKSQNTPTRAKSTCMTEDVSRSAPISSQAQQEYYLDNEITWAESVSPLVNKWKVKQNFQGEDQPDHSPPGLRVPRILDLKTPPVKRLRSREGSPVSVITEPPKPLEILEKLVATLKHDQTSSSDKSPQTPARFTPEIFKPEGSPNTSEDFLLSQALDEVESRLRADSPVLSQKSSSPKETGTPRRVLRIRAKMSPLLRQTQSERIRAGIRTLGRQTKSSVDVDVKEDSEILTSERELCQAPRSLSALNQKQVGLLVDKIKARDDCNAFTVPSSQHVIRSFSFRSRNSSGIGETQGCREQTPKVAIQKLQTTSCAAKAKNGPTSATTVSKVHRVEKQAFDSSNVTKQVSTAAINNNTTRPTEPIEKKKFGTTAAKKDEPVAKQTVCFRFNRQSGKDAAPNPPAATSDSNHTNIVSNRNTESGKVPSPRQVNWKRWSSMPLESPSRGKSNLMNGFDDDDDFESLISGIKDDSELQTSFSQPAAGTSKSDDRSTSGEALLEDDFDLDLDMLQAVESVEAMHKQCHS